jgi:transcription elongation factor Elf1
MAKKKKAQKAAPTIKKIKLETVFDCPFCNHSLCVEVKM